MSFDLHALHAAVAAHGTVARIVITGVAGSAPRGTGTAMLVWASGQSGTIGGGALELEATQAARMLLTTRGATRRQYPLGPTLGQCCGGAVTLVTEVFAAANLPTALPFARRISGKLPRPNAKTFTDKDGWLIETALPQPRPLWIYGAGHVGRALVHVMAPLPDFAITWVDTHADRFPLTDVTTVVATDPAQVVRHAPRDAAHLILTYSHAIDLALCHAILSHDFNSAGLIGSATKWARFRSRLAALGHAPAQISRIACPIGDPLLGKHPAALALGVATAMIGSQNRRSKDRTA